MNPICEKCGTTIGFADERCPYCGTRPRPEPRPEPESERYEPEADAGSPPEVPPFPGAIRVAAWAWIFDGVAMILTSCFGAAADAMLRVNNPKIPPNPAASCSTTIGLAIAGGLLVAGIQLARRKMKNPLLPAILTLLLALFYLALGVACMISLEGGGLKNPRLEELFGVVAVVCSVFGVMFLIPGVFALIGRGRDREWKRASARLAKYKRKRRRARDVVLDDDSESE